MSIIHQPREPDLDARILAFPIVAGTLLFALFLRLWYVQVVRAEALAERADTSQQTRVPRLAPRGLIVDRAGKLVAGVHSEIVITGIPKVLNKHPEILSKLAKLLDADENRLKAKLADGAWRPYLPTPLYVGAPLAIGAKLAESAADYPGVGVESQPMRFYPDGTSFAHVLGTVRVPNADDVKRLDDLGLDAAPYVGRDGIERAYEEDLMGEAGADKLLVDAKRRPLKLMGSDSAVPGNKLILTLDSRLQKIAAQALSSKGYRGAVVAIEPKTGEVLCMVSNPGFDQNQFQGGISTEQWSALVNNPGKPLLNRAIYASYAPGSTFKPVTALAAYETGRFSTTMTVVCEGGYKLGKRFAKCLGHHGPITFERAMEQSCNTYFYTLGMRTGSDAMTHAALEFGLGQKAGLEIGGEGAGTVPTQEWIQKNRKPAVWRPGDTLNMSIGQGDVGVTPIQMADLASMIANEGVTYKPHLVKGVMPSDSQEVRRIEPEQLRTINASPVFWSVLKDSLRRVIDQGTAQIAKIDGIHWAGKTGSAEHAKASKTHAWFMGFAPVDNPQIAIAVVVESAGHGGEVAAPIARDVVKAYLRSSSANLPNASSKP